MRNSVRIIRSLALITILGGYGQAGVAASEPGLPACDSTCGEEESCGTECEEPVGEIWHFTTCGEYEDGWRGGQCDAAWDSCLSICPANGLPEDECYEGGELETCDDFGTYGYCGDDVCGLAIGEDSNSCSEDCVAPLVSPPPQTSNDEEIWADAATDIDNAMTNGGDSEHDVNEMLGILYQYGLVDELLDFSEDFEPPAPVMTMVEGDSGLDQESAPGDLVGARRAVTYEDCRHYGNKAAKSWLGLAGAYVGFAAVGVLCPPCGAAAALGMWASTVGMAFIETKAAPAVALCFLAAS